MTELAMASAFSTEHPNDGILGLSLACDAWLSAALSAGEWRNPATLLDAADEHRRLATLIEGKGRSGSPPIAARRRSGK
jgi:hypothetical protein